jgi:hypothetical protein
MGLYEIFLVFFELMLICICLISDQKYYFIILVSGLICLGLFVFSILVDISFVYQKLGISIYLVLIISLMFIFAGTVGAVTKLIIHIKGVTH